MKKSIILLVVLGGITAGAIVYLSHAAKPAPAPAAEAVPPPAESAPAETPAPPVPVAVSAAKTELAPPVALAAPVQAQTTSEEPTNSIRKTVDALLSAHQQKQAMLDQLRKSGQLDAVIAELQQREAANPNDPALPTTLGEALLNKVRALHESGGDDHDQMGILAMQADQQFNTALKLDPKNWEAQFVKCTSMYYWPADAQRDGDVAQRLAGLIDQQESMPANPAFAKTYLLLGNQYLKMGKPEEAAATWRLGAQQFPADPELQAKVSPQ